MSQPEGFFKHLQRLNRAETMLERIQRIANSEPPVDQQRAPVSARRRPGAEPRILPEVTKTQDPLAVGERDLAQDRIPSRVETPASRVVPKTLGLQQGRRPLDSANIAVPGSDTEVPATTSVVSGQLIFKRWRMGEPIDKPLPSGANPAWNTVQSCYWKNRHMEVQRKGEFGRADLSENEEGPRTAGL